MRSSWENISHAAHPWGQSSKDRAQGVALLIDIENSIKAQIGGKLPSVPALQAEYEKLQTQKESLYADYGKLKNRYRNMMLSNGT